MRFPYVVGSLWNGKDQSPETNSDGNNDVRVIHSRADHKITFKDGSQPLVQVELADGKRLTLDRNGIELDDAQGNKVTIQSGGGSITIQAAASLSLKAPQISLEATGTLTVKSNGTLTVQGSLVTIN
jgi:phage baseplate assembly protein gpV